LSRIETFNNRLFYYLKYFFVISILDAKLIFFQLHHWSLENTSIQEE